MRAARIRSPAVHGVGGHRAVVQVHRQEDLVRDGVAQLLGELPDQPGRPGEQREPAQQRQRQAEVGQRRAAHAGPVERQRLPEHLRVHPPDRGEQRRCGPNSPSSRAICISRGVRGSPSLWTWWPRPGTNRPAARCAVTVSSASASQPASSVGSSAARDEHVVQEPAGVLGDPQEPRARAEQPGGQRALDRVRRGQVGQPRDDRGRGEAVVGQRGEHRLEHPHLAGLGRRWVASQNASSPNPTSPMTSRGEVVAEQRDRVAGGGAQGRRVLVHDARAPILEPAAVVRHRARPAPAAAARTGPASRRT